MITYEELLKKKSLIVPNTGIEVDPDELNPMLFEWQRKLVRWSLRKGRAALFADTGLGKTAMQTEWARLVYKHTGRNVLILAPLAVARQTMREANKFGVVVKYCRKQDEIQPGITITNYEMLQHFNPDEFGAVVLDESSILKSFEGKTRSALIEAFSRTPMKLCCTATPAPNDIQEIANHAEFLSVMKRPEMLAAFFIHDDNGYRLKGHANRGPFWKWLASWSMAVRKPSDLGDFSDEGYVLPGLEINSVIIKSDWQPTDRLFAVGLKGVTERASVRKMTLAARVEALAELVNRENSEQWLLWCGLNDEGVALHKLIPGSVLVEGSQSPDVKAEALEKFANGEIRVMITKSSIAGFGMNFQGCARMAFCGMGDSYEDYYQSIRRCYRFGQSRKVAVYIVLSDLEETIFNNVLRKEKEAATMANELIKHVAEFERAEIVKGVKNKMEYSEKTSQGKGWIAMLGDSAERLKELESNSVGLSVFSEPFASLFTYSNTERDLGNCANYDEFWEQFSYITSELYRVMMPGRLVAAHVQQLPMIKSTDGVIGMKDFRGHNIEHFTKQGFIYHGEICIDKDPQAQAIRTKAKSLMFVQLEKDASWMRPAFADYILLFRKPGENTVAIKPELTRDEWIEWARPIWYGIKESDTLNAAEARSSDDERHICPLQIGTIERCVRLWSNRGETVLTPFMGIGSEVYTAVKLGRKGIGCELNPNYYRVAIRNIQKAERDFGRPTLDDLLFQNEEVAV